MKTVFTLLAALIFFEANAKPSLPLAEATREISRSDFSNCSAIDEDTKMQSWLNRDDLFFYSFDIDRGLKPNDMHKPVRSDWALAIRSMVLLRDYEYAPLEIYSKNRGKLAKKKLDREDHGNPFDTIHVLAVPESKLSEKQRQRVENAMPDFSNGYLGYYANDDRTVKTRVKILKDFKKATKSKTSHKKLKGPYFNDKGRKSEEEWGSGPKAAHEAVCYTKPSPFYSLHGAQNSENLYVLLYSGDGTTKLGGFKYRLFGELDDLMTVVKIPMSDLQNLGTSLVHVRRDPTVKIDGKFFPVDFAIQFEVVNSLAQ